MVSAVQPWNPIRELPDVRRYFDDLVRRLLWRETGSEAELLAHRSSNHGSSLSTLRAATAQTLLCQCGSDLTGDGLVLYIPIRKGVKAMPHPIEPWPYGFMKFYKECYGKGKSVHECSEQPGPLAPAYAMADQNAIPRRLSERRECRNPAALSLAMTSRSLINTPPLLCI
jgi:hypothetical protein